MLPLTQDCGNKSWETKNIYLNVQVYFGVNFYTRNPVQGGLLPTASTAANYFLFHYFEKPAGQLED